MQPEFWHDRWRRNQTGFHQLEASRHLTRHWRNLRLEKGSRIFVPLCGKSLDLLWLRDQGHVVSGVEVSIIALEAFCMENGIPARRRMLRDFDRYEDQKLELYAGDFFALTPADIGPIAGAYDRAALISWTEDLREPYAQHMTELTPVGAVTLLVTLEYDQSQMAGPPFSVSATEMQRLYVRSFDIEELSRQDIIADEPRMRSKGVIELQEVCYRLTRR